MKKTLTAGSIKAFVFISASVTCMFIPGFNSVMPPLFAIGLAFLTGRVLISLFCGIWMGSALIIGFSTPCEYIKALGYGFFTAADTWIIKGLVNTDHIKIVVFSLSIGGMIGIISRSGGMQGVVNSFSKLTASRRRSLIMTWFLGLLIFFDDYANNLIVGNSMRPLTDKMKVSREKLSFIIDSTSAPVASVSILSTWIGYEIGLIGSAFSSAGISEDPYMAFIYSLPYRFYAWLLLIMIPIYIFMNRDTGVMLKAENRALSEKNDVPLKKFPKNNGENSDLQTPTADKCRWYNAVLPIALMITSTVAGIIISGISNTASSAKNFSEIVGAANSFDVLIWGTLISTVFSILLISVQKILTLEEIMSAWIKGVKSMMTAMLILAMAWGLSIVTEELGTAAWISEILSDKLPVFILPALVFLIAGVTSFATGSSWGSMAILFPTAIPTMQAMGTAQGTEIEIMAVITYATVGSILTGSILGDHCSPISDTTIMASMACRINHIEHVRTQLPYAAVLGIISLFAGYIPAGFGANPYMLIIIQVIIAILILYFIGKKPEEISHD
ncbi:MAG: Na+/H+ antiporter NhaC family protein [bacterium]